MKKHRVRRIWARLAAGLTALTAVLAVLIFAFPGESGACEDVSDGELLRRAAGAALADSTFSIRCEEINGWLSRHSDGELSVWAGEKPDQLCFSLPVSVGPFSARANGCVQIKEEDGCLTGTVQSVFLGALPVSPAWALSKAPLPDFVAVQGQTLTVALPSLSLGALGISASLSVVSCSYENGVFRIKTDPALSLLGQTLEGLLQMALG